MVYLTGVVHVVFDHSDDEMPGWDQAAPMSLAWDVHLGVVRQLANAASEVRVAFAKPFDGVGDCRQPLPRWRLPVVEIGPSEAVVGLHEFEQPDMVDELSKPESTEGRPWGQPLKKAEGAPLNLG